MPISNKPFLILQLRPENETADSEFAAILRYGELDTKEVSRMRVERFGLPKIRLEDFAAIIVGGSPFDLSTPDTLKRAIQHKIESDFVSLFDRVVTTDFPFLGACSGNGLLGSYCGATISGRFAEPVSGRDITITEAGAKDPLLMGFPSKIRVLLGHKEACDEVPPGTILLATSKACPVQMFRVGNNVYATQFHPEGDEQGFSVRVRTYKHHGYFPANTADDLIDSFRGEKTPYANKILKRFVDRFRI